MGNASIGTSLQDLSSCGHRRVFRCNATSDAALAETTEGQSQCKQRSWLPSVFLLYADMMAVAVFRFLFTSTHQPAPYTSWPSPKLQVCGACGAKLSQAWWEQGRTHTEKQTSRISISPRSSCGASKKLAFHTEPLKTVHWHQATPETSQTWQRPRRKQGADQRPFCNHNPM